MAFKNCSTHAHVSTGHTGLLLKIMITILAVAFFFFLCVVHIYSHLIIFSLQLTRSLHLFGAVHFHIDDKEYVGTKMPFVILRECEMIRWRQKENENFVNKSSYTQHILIC